MATNETKNMTRQTNHTLKLLLGPTLLVGLQISFVALMSSCAYRFTNLHVENPRSIRTIAIEAVYDTSREVLPHEIIWEELQAAFARDGHLRVVGRHEADALLRVHITKAAVAPGGDTYTTKPTDDDPQFEAGDDAPAFNRFRRLKVAGEARQKMELAVSMRVDCFHLESRELLLDRVYNLSESFRAVRPSGLPEATGFLRTEESMHADIAKSTRQIAEAIVQDLLIR